MYDVVIVGGGPAGLFLACDLRLAGVSAVVLERLREPDVSDKAHGLTGLSVRLLHQRGLFERCGGVGAPTPAPGFYFGAMPLALRLLGGDHPLYLLKCYQAELERVLLERALSLQVDFRRGWEMRSLSQANAHVEVVASDPDGNETTLQAKYVVGCDGGRSAVRAAVGIEFQGARDDAIVDRTALIAPNEELPKVVFHRTERGIFSLMPHDPQVPIVHTSEWESGPPSHEPMTLAEMQQSVTRVLGKPVELSPPPGHAPDLRRVRGRNTRIAERYRVGRVFIAGDAAHISYGPTLNLAVQDAANLAWKLAAAVHGWAPPHLLDTYEQERRAVGERVVMATKAETALEAPGAAVTALRQLHSELLQKPENIRAIAALMAGADVRYDMGPAPSDATGWFVSPTAGADELLREGRPLLLDRTGIGDVAARWSQRVKIVSLGASGESMLIRPDGYVAWSGQTSLGLEAALTRWFG